MTDICPECQANSHEHYIELTIALPLSVFDWLSAKAESNRDAECPDWAVEDEATIELWIAMDISLEIAAEDAAKETAA